MTPGGTVVCRYVSGRTRAAGEINGNSGNLNNALCNVIYPEYQGRAADIPPTELVVVFDADMACKKEFFLKVLEVLWDSETALCLTPQVRGSRDHVTVHAGKAPPQKSWHACKVGTAQLFAWSPGNPP